MARVRIKTGTEGPVHDPYSWMEIHFTKTDGTRVVYRAGGLGYDRLFVNEKKIMEVFDRTLEAEFHELTGLTARKAVEIYYTRFHHGDPMGSASLYE